MQVKSIVAAFDPAGEVAATRSREATLALLDTVPDALARTTFEPGHVTGSAVVFDPKGADIVLVRHERVGRWIQPGGHVERHDADVEATARREVLEETGLELTAAVAPLVRIDIHAIPPAKGEPAHLHHDLTFAMVATAREPHHRGEGSWVWCGIRDLDRFRVDDALRRSVARAAAWFRSRRL
ncbi:MAG TPA: NUDIX domain-containing protein [Gemmatimonadales bacterium]|jgi:8-oxo-dGTP pyrophosphatase MutT (NUDIX family)